MKELRERYVGEVARDYEARRQGAQWDAEHAALADELDRLRPRTLLDVPCGTGRFWPLYRERGIRATGRDLSADMLAQAKAKGWMDCGIGDVFELGAADQSFDAVVCVRLLNWMTPVDASEALSGLARVTGSALLATIGLGTGRRGRTPQHPDTVLEIDGMPAPTERVLVRGPHWRYSLVTWESP